MKTAWNLALADLFTQLPHPRINQTCIFWRIHAYIDTHTPHSLAFAHRPDLPLYHTQPAGSLPEHPPAALLALELLNPREIAAPRKRLQTAETQRSALTGIKKKPQLIRAPVVPLRHVLRSFSFHVVQGSKPGPSRPPAPCSGRTGAVLDSDHMARGIYQRDAAERYGTLLSYPFHRLRWNCFIFDFVRF